MRMYAFLWLNVLAKIKALLESVEDYIYVNICFGCCCISGFL